MITQTIIKIRGSRHSISLWDINNFVC